ncbi:hypothetical protein GGR50DRAFT_682849 [Xylaria sp. CBS 124048]|nr:hypothetical protein GGR50DRAFT_682849 [Xylaria sp. CBS 124048]
MLIRLTSQSRIRTCCGCDIMVAENLKVGRACCGKSPSRYLSTSAPLRLHVSKPAGSRDVVRLTVYAGSLHFCIILVEVNRNLFICIAPELVRPAQHEILRLLLLSSKPVNSFLSPLSVPVTVVSVALHHRYLNHLAPRVGSTVLALIQAVLELAWARLEAKVDLLTHCLLFLYLLGVCGGSNLFLICRRNVRLVPIAFVGRYKDDLIG